MGEKATEQVVGRVLERIDATITQDPQRWKAWPGGWPDEAGSALVDAVFSARATYRTRNNRGVFSQVEAWRQTSLLARTSLAALEAEIASSGAHAWAIAFGNEQHSPGRPVDAPDGPWKAAAILEAARGLRGLGVDRADDIDDSNAHEVKSVLRSVRGIGFATTNYFLMLLGRPGVKPDRMVHRFLHEATGTRWNDADAAGIVEAVAARMTGVAPHELDHAIWSYESGTAASG
jgi:hypothetical protein